MNMLQTFRKYGQTIETHGNLSRGIETIKLSNKEVRPYLTTELGYSPPLPQKSGN
jgi:hypothetical protein